VEATDLDMGARVRLERVEILEEGEIAVQASLLSSLTREILDKQVLLEGLAEGRGTHLRAQSCEFKLLGEDPREFPDVPPFAVDNAFSVSREKFVESLRRVGIAASRDLTRFQLTGVFFEVEDDELLLTATDGKRLTHDKVRVENPRKIRSSAIVPNRAVDVLLKVLAQGEAVVRIGIKDPDLQVSFGSGEVTARVIEGSYPDYRVALSQKITRRISTKRGDLLAAARTASLMADRQTATVLFDFQALSVSLSTHASDVGESRIEVPITLDGDPVEMRFNPTYLIDALRAVADEEVRLEVSDGEKPAVLRGGQHYRHLMMPVVTK
jgi:DNA polymerase-3 subunit beta